MNNKEYCAVRTSPKSNLKTVETDIKNILIHIHVHDTHDKM